MNRDTLLALLTRRRDIVERVIAYAEAGGAPGGGRTREERRFCDAVGTWENSVLPWHVFDEPRSPEEVVDEVFRWVPRIVVMRVVSVESNGCARLYAPGIPGDTQARIVKKAFGPMDAVRVALLGMPIQDADGVLRPVRARFVDKDGNEARTGVHVNCTILGPADPWSVGTVLEIGPPLVLPDFPLPSR